MNKKNYKTVKQMKSSWLRLLLAVSLLICLLLAVILISSYSKTAAALIWLLGTTAVKVVKWLTLEKQSQPQIQKLDLLDTEYAAIMAGGQTVAGEVLCHPDIVLQEIVRYRQSTKHKQKDLALYRMGNCLKLFSPRDEQMIKQEHTKLNDSQRQQVKQFLIEQFGITL
jgi:hypothetical protein